MKKILFGLIAFLALNVNAQQGTVANPPFVNDFKINTTIGGVNRPVAIKDLTAQADYSIEKEGSNVVAHPKVGSGLAKYTGTDLLVVLQSCVNALTPQGPPDAGNGGTIVIGRGTFNTTNELTIQGFETFGSGAVDPKAQVRVLGSGGSTYINQTGVGKNIFVIKNRASVVIQDMFLAVSSQSASAIWFKANDVHEYSSVRSTVNNIRINSASTTQPAFRAENFFYMKVPKMDIYQTSYTNMVLENKSATTNFGNSEFGALTLIAPNNNLYSALLITSDNNHPMNLNKFDALYIGGEYYGQPQGRGVVFKGSAFNTIAFADIEYMPFPIEFGSNIISYGSTSNVFLSGYLYPSTGGTAITSTVESNGNVIENMHIEGDDAGIGIITDLQQYRPANAYRNLYLSGTLNPATKIAITTPSQTEVSWTQNGTEITRTSRVENLSATDATGMMTYRAANGLKTGLSIGVANTILSSTGTLPTWISRYRIGTVATGATITPTASASEQYNVTALAANTTFAVPSGTNIDGQRLIIRITSDATARTLTWNAIYRGSTDIPLPTTTTISKTMYLEFVYNSLAVKWDLLKLTNGF